MFVGVFLGFIGVLVASIVYIMLTFKEEMGEFDIGDDPTEEVKYQFIPVEKGDSEYEVIDEIQESRPMGVRAPRAQGKDRENEGKG